VKGEAAILNRNPDHRPPYASRLTPHGFFRRLREFLRWFYRYRSIRLTPDGTRFVLLTLAVGVAAINTGNNLLYLLLAMLLSLIVMSGILSEQCLRQLEIRRLLPQEVFANRPTTGAFSITNHKPRLPTFSLRILDVIGSAAVERGIHLLHLPPRATTIQSYPLLITRRGYYRLEGIKLLTRFPFGLFLKAANLPLGDELVVFPELQPLPEHLTHDLMALGQEQTMPRRGPGVALHNLRGYLAGDDSRSIHWKISARQAQLMVKETEAEDQRHVTLALPTETPEAAHAAFERAVTLTASLAAYFHEQGYAVALVVGQTDIPVGSGPAHLHRIFRALALCQPEPCRPAQPLPEGFLRLGELTTRGDLTILVAPWPDPRTMPMEASVSRLLRMDTAS
jgi:uncharacterized protein (DUF58 family)